jgi:hypothetical protein
MVSRTRRFSLSPPPTTYPIIFFSFSIIDHQDKNTLWTLRAPRNI